MKQIKPSMYGIIKEYLNSLSIGDEFTVDTTYKRCKELNDSMRWNKDYVYQTLVKLKNAKYSSGKVGTKVYQKLKDVPQDLALSDLEIISRQIKLTDNE